MTATPAIDDVLAFWREAGPDRWYTCDTDFDANIRERFLDLWHDAVAGRLSSWEDSDDGALALVIVLDQFPRNMFRDDARAFATDAKALEVARHAVAAGFDQKVGETGRTFFYLPFEHSEDMSCQDRSVELFRALPGWDQPGSPFQYAQRHWDIIRRFGRFPHRNRTLGRENTPTEAEFLTLPDSGF